jgi:hypothetical protein
MDGEHGSSVGHPFLAHAKGDAVAIGALLGDLHRSRCRVVGVFRNVSGGFPPVGGNGSGAIGGDAGCGKRRHGRGEKAVTDGAHCYSCCLLLVVMLLQLLQLLLVAFVA